MTERSQTFSKQDRLLHKKEFDEVLEAAHLSSAGGKCIFHLPPFVIYRKAHNRPRLGVSVAKRIIKRAHDRNRIKRCVKEFFRLHKSEFNGDYLVRLVARPANLEFKTLSEPLSKVLKNLSSEGPLRK